MLETLKEAVERAQALPAYATYKDKLTYTFGLVVESDQPRRSRGTDHIQTIKVLDESYPEGVQLVLFAPDVSMMPAAAQPGDVLELQRVLVQFWQDRPQLFAKMSPPHSFGFALYRPTNNNSNNSNNNSGNNQQLQEQPAQVVQPLQVYNITPSAHHAAQRLPQLQALGVQAVRQASMADTSCVYMRRIKDLTPPEEEGQRPPCVDMRVKVLAIDERSASEGVILYVWDATDAKPVSASLQLPPSEWRGAQLKLTRPRRLVMPLVVGEPPTGLQVLQGLPHVGTALPVVVLPGAVPSTGLPKVGEWIKIKTVGVAVVQGQWQVVFGPGSRLAQSVPGQGFEGWYNQRLADCDTCEWAPKDRCNPRLATVCALPHLPRSTIREVLIKTAGGGQQQQQQQGQQATTTFRVLVRLLGYLPQQLEQWCKMRPRQEGGSGEEPVWEWAAHLWVEDATGEVRPLLLANECTKLLGGTPPQCLLNNATAVQELKSRLQHLATVDDEGGVWMEVAITALPVASQPAAAAGQAGEQQQQSQEQEEDQPPVSGQQEGLLEAQQGATEGDGNEGQEQQQQLVVVHTGQAQQQQQPVFVIHDAVVPQPGDELQHEGQQDAAWLPQQQQPQEEGTAASEQLDEQQQQRQQAEAEAGENQPGTHNAQPPSEPAAAGRPKKRQRRRRGG